MLRKSFLFYFRRFSSVNINQSFLKNLTTIDGIDLTHIDEALRISPELQNFGPNLWQRTYETFINQGFSSSAFLGIITNNPSLLHRPSEKIINSLECWRSTQFGEKQVITLIENYSQLLDITAEGEILKKIDHLKDYVMTRKNVWRLFMNSPNLIYDKFSIIDQKISYLKKEMKIDIVEVVKSAVFSHNIDKIKCRHIFLERLGMYKVRNPKADPTEPSKNPKLYQIMDTSDKRFAIKVAFVTLEEYETFTELFARELNEENRIDKKKNQSSSDDDSSDEED